MQTWKLNSVLMWKKEKVQSLVTLSPWRLRKYCNCMCQSVCTSKVAWWCNAILFSAAMEWGKNLSFPEAPWLVFASAPSMAALSFSGFQLSYLIVLFCHLFMFWRPYVSNGGGILLFSNTWTVKPQHVQNTEEFGISLSLSLLHTHILISPFFQRPQPIVCGSPLQPFSFTTTLSDRLDFREKKRMIDQRSPQWI